MLAGLLARNVLNSHIRLDAPVKFDHFNRAPMNSKSRYFVIQGRIPGESEDTMAYIEARVGEVPTTKFIHDSLYQGRIPDDWETRSPTIKENSSGQWAYIRNVIEFPTPPLEAEGPGPVLPQFVDLPTHDPSRYETADCLGNPNCTNGMRAVFALSALIAFQQACHMDDDPISAIGDLVCDLLHLSHQLEADPTQILESAVGHFYAEAGPIYASSEADF